MGESAYRMFTGLARTWAGYGKMEPPMIMPVSQVSQRPLLAVPPDDARLRHLARELETEFLTEMLRHAGTHESPGAFGGGLGEEQFLSFLRRSEATAIVASGGIGLAETLFNALREAGDER
jgi:Rod binding domain-containing protein